MRAVVVIVLLAGCTTVATERVEQSIVGGQIADPAEFPTVVALENGPGQWFCTGTLIDKDWVLTAAHCVQSETAATLFVRFDAGDVNDGTSGHAVAVAEVHGNPGYDGIAWDNDIAVLKLAASVTDREVTPIHRDLLPAATSVTIAGYGDGTDTGTGSGILRKLVTPTIDCATTGDSTLSNANVICFDASDGNASCYGDSGGPGYVTNGAKLEVAGVTSGGTQDSCIQGFDIYTAVGGELEFVDQFVPLVAPDPPPSDGGGGCQASRGGGGLLLVGLAMLFARRRR